MGGVIREVAVGRWEFDPKGLYCDRCGYNEDKVRRYGMGLRHIVVREHYYSGPLRTWDTDSDTDLCDKCFDELRQMGMRRIGDNHYELPGYIPAYAPAARKSALYQEHASHNFRY